ncbi:MAG TPA: hypothetical protein VF533_19545, partial [Solirubrobacteraceae bacterium]
MPALLALTAPAAAGADIELRATVTPDRVVFGETRALTYRVEMTTGATPERFSLGASTGAAFGGFDGALLRLGGNARLEGPGTVGPPLTSHGDAFPCSRSDLPERHGALSNDVAYWVELPANARSALVFDAAVASTPPWPGSRYEVSLLTFDDGGGTLERPGPVPVAAATPAGRTGVQLDIATEPRSEGLCGYPPPRVDRRSITITGESDPPLAGQRVMLRYVAPGRRRAETLAAVPVAADGTFVHRGWRPQEPGVYEIAAAYASQRPDLADDFVEPRTLEIGVPAGEPRPPEPPTGGDPPAYDPAAGPPPPLRASVLSERLRAGPRGRVRVRLACPSAAGAPCKGVLELVHGGRRVTHRRVRM